MNTKTLSILNLIGFIFTVVVNGLANGLPINGITTGELSDLYPNLFVPAGFTFSIWGLIYLWLLVFVIYGLVSAFSKDPKKADWLKQIGPLFLVQALCNGAWIFAWHYQVIGLSLLIMLGILGSLIMMHRKLEIGVSQSENPVTFLVRTPIAIYLGWITVATVANVTTLLVDAGFQGGGVPEWIWAALVIGVATVITLLMQFRKGDFFHSMVVLWALFGIYSKRSEDTDPITALLFVIGGCALVIIGIGVWQWAKQGLFRTKVI
jgi:benzodiazapine receptor